MNKVAAPALATCLAVAMLFGTPAAQIDQAPPAALTAMTPAPAPSPVAGLPADALPDSGRCRIWYDQIPAHAQPAQMECEHAHWLARSWGGRVVSHEAELAAYEGRNDFTGVAEADLPRPGYCRVWSEGGASENTDCRTARRAASANGGRVLFMPL